MRRGISCRTGGRCFLMLRINLIIFLTPPLHAIGLIFIYWQNSLSLLPHQYYTNHLSVSYLGIEIIKYFVLGTILNALILLGVYYISRILVAAFAKAFRAESSNRPIVVLVLALLIYVLFASFTSFFLLESSVLQFEQAIRTDGYISYYKLLIFYGLLSAILMCLLLCFATVTRVFVGFLYSL